jgi:hypothetical protein
MTFEVVPSALRVIVGAAEEATACAWLPPVSAAP